MRIIIVGAGTSAEVLIQYLEKSRHDVVIIDKDKNVVESVTDKYSVNGFCGSGVSREVLISAGADTADVIISLTAIDEINLLACSMAKSIGTRYAIAELEQNKLIDDKAYLSEKFGIDYILTPNSLVASSIAKQIYFNCANRVETFFDSRILLAEITIDKDSCLANEKLQNIKPVLKADFIVFGVLRDDRLIVPKGEFILKAGDAIGIIADESEMAKLFSGVNLARKTVKSVMIIGGGELGSSLAEKLIEHHIKVKLVENNRDCCEQLIEKLPKAKIIFGNGNDVQLLDDEKIGRCDACICVSGSDEVNLLSSLIAWTNGVNNIITKIKTASYDSVLRKVTINITVMPDRIIAKKILECLLSLEQKGSDSKLSKYYYFGSSMLKISEFVVPFGFSKTGMSLMSEKFRLKKGIIIGAIKRDDSIIIPKGTDTIKCGDELFVLSESQLEINSLTDIFNKLS